MVGQIKMWAESELEILRCKTRIQDTTHHITIVLLIIQQIGTVFSIKNKIKTFSM